MSERVLQTPELVFRIGWFVPLWHSNNFHPKDLVSCIKVCRLWRNVLTPLLWMVYDDSDLSVPKAAAHDNRQHIRYMRFASPNRSNIPQVTRLKGLALGVIYECKQEYFQLLEANAALASLHIWLDSYLKSEFAPALFKPLTSLQYLQLAGYAHLRAGVMKSILDSNQRLETLILEVKTTMDADFMDWRVYASIKKLSFRTYPGKPTWLFSLLQYCPNVEALTVSEYYDECDNRPQIALLSKTLQEHCKKLQVLHFNDNMFRNCTSLCTEDYLGLIQATSNLVELRLSMIDFPSALCDALLCGSAHSLEVLSLFIYGQSTTAESIVSVGSVLSSCPNLQRLQVHFSNYVRISQAMNEALAARPWVCNNLKTIILRPTRFCVNNLKCPSSCKGKKSKDSSCLVEKACEAEIQKQGWKNMNPQYQCRHVPLARQQHRAVLLTAASNLEHIDVVDLGFYRYGRAKRS
ncbi:hypothetical protein BGZ94_010345 [Podila epigama]|nr:hypothetical protein BGZ94_010345 [Podila epigama]